MTTAVALVYVFEREAPGNVTGTVVTQNAHFGILAFLGAHDVNDRLGDERIG